MAQDSAKVVLVHGSRDHALVKCGLATSEQSQKTGREPRHVRDDEDADPEYGHHRQRGRAHFEHGTLEAVRRQEDVQADERRQKSELEVRDEDDPEMHRMNPERGAEGHDQRDDHDERRPDLHQPADREQEQVQHEEERDDLGDVLQAERLTDLARKVLNHLGAGKNSKAVSTAETTSNRLPNAIRLYTVCERKKRAAEALSYNGLVQSWPEITRLARESGKPKAEQAQLFEQE